MGGATSSTSKTRDPVARAAGPITTSTTCSARCRSTRPSSTGAATAATCPPPSGRSRSATAWSTPAAFRENGMATVRIWQANIGKTIVAHVPITNGAVQETGDFELDGVTFPAAEVQLEFMDPAADEEGARRRDVPDRQPGRRARRARRRHAQGDDDQRRHPDHLRQRRGASATPAPSCRTRSTAIRRRWRCSRRSARTARCAWA